MGLCEKDAYPLIMVLETMVEWSIAAPTENVQSNPAFQSRCDSRFIPNVRTLYSHYIDIFSTLFLLLKSIYFWMAPQAQYTRVFFQRLHVEIVHHLSRRLPSGINDSNLDRETMKKTR